MSNKHDANVRKSTLVNFQIGLIASLLFTYLMFEVYTAKKSIVVNAEPPNTFENTTFTMGEFEVEKVPKKELAIKKEPVVHPTKFIVKDDDEKLSELEKEFVTDEPSNVEVAPSIGSIIDIDSDEDNISVDFRVVEDVPVFPGCEKMGTNEEKAACFSEKIGKIVSKRFNTDLGERYGLSGLQRIYTLFEVSSDGTIQNIRIRAPHPKLKKEAERVINLFPEMTPGKQRGRPVTVTYQLPIVFKIQD